MERSQTGMRGVNTNGYSSAAQWSVRSLQGWAGGRTAAHEFRSPPQSVTVAVAALLEPLLAVSMLLGLQHLFDQPLNRPAAVLCIGVLLLSYPGRNRFHETLLNAAVDIVSGWLWVLGLLLLCGFATRSFHLFDERVLWGWALLTPLVQLAAARVGGALVKARARHPAARRRALVIGAGAVGDRVAGMLRGLEPFGHDFVGCLEDRELSRCAESAREHVVGRLEHAADVIRHHDIRDVYITLPLSVQPRITRLLRALHDAAVSIHFVPDVFGVGVIQGRMRNIDGVPVVSIVETPFVGVNGVVKRLSDIVMASLILLLIAPLMIGIAIGVKLGSPGPVIFRQRRNGLDGKEIVVYKFRSMTTQDDGAQVRQATRGDPRVTPFGAFLRRTSLDELPQFINVLQGRMSIVGPRPHAVAHNEEYRRIIDAYMLRHKVRPGITGWAQVNGHRGETDVVEKMLARVEHDIDYLRSWSLTLDLRIIARTIKLVVFDRQAY